MPTDTTSYRDRSSAAITLPAETHEIACSVLRPPNTTATRTLSWLIAADPSRAPAARFPATRLGRCRCASLDRVRDDVVTEPPPSPAPTFSRGLRLAGAALHLYTASGSVLALFIVVAAVEHKPVTALWLGLIAL